MDKIKQSLTSNSFIALIYIITVFLWWLNEPIIAMILYVILAIIIIITDTKRITIVTLIMAALISFRDTNLSSTAPIITITVIVALPFIIFDIAKTKFNFKNKILIALLIFLGANVLSLINITKDTIIWGLLGVAQTFAFALLFFYLSNRQKEGDFKYLGKNAAALGISIAVEFAIYALTYDGDMIGKNIKLGWGMSNSIAMLVTMLVPLTYSLYLQNQNNKFPLFAVIIELTVVLLMLSKGAYIAMAVVLVLLGILLLKKAKDRKTLIYDHIFAFGLYGIVLLAIFQIDSLKQGFLLYFERMDDRGWFIDASRIDIYKYSLSIFKRFPLFGSGSYTGVYYLVEGGFPANLIHYHNIFLHSLATLGIVGLGSFLYFLYVSIKSTFVNQSYNITVFIAIVGMIIHGMVDNTWYNPLIIICLLTALSVLGKVKQANLVHN